ncbi:MAG TPA: ATPase, T2SS/T4P/T4SS family [Candidatus Paceibacterota bacterium]|nr:ATPase, T2SS/T4P/T4SS family [Candidatus Paceibacterota bacterium]
MYVEEKALKDFLVSSGLVTRSQLAEVISQGQGEALYDALVRRGIVAEDELRRAVAHASGVEFVQLEPEQISFETLSIIPEPLARAYNIVAYAREGNRVEVAMLDLDAFDQISYLRREYGLVPVPRLTTAESLKKTLRTYQKYLKEKFASLLSHSEHTLNALLAHALLSNAHGVHLDLRETGLLVRYRIQGMLHDAMLLPKEAGHIFERIKELARLSLTLHVPQEGTFSTALWGGETVHVRVQNTPTAAGEKMFLNLRRAQQAREGYALESLGFHGESLASVHNLIAQDSGLILIAGRENTGKTTLAYTMLDELGRRPTSIVAVETEVEHRLPHVSHIEIRPDLGITAAAALRAALKQDPDIVFIGSIADDDTALLAAQAASRGMLVIGCIESPSAVAALLRMRSWGVPAKLLAAVLRGVVAVDLVKRLCPYEKEEYRLSRAEGAPLEPVANFGKVLAALKEEDIVGKDTQWKEVLFARAHPCPECEGGYRGLIGLQSVLTVSRALADSIYRDAPGYDLLAQAREEGMLTLEEDGIFKAAAGITSIEELLRVSQQDGEEQ